MTYPWKYYLSDSCPYEKLICRDAGPAYAKSMGWSTDSICALDTSPLPVSIIDNRIDPNEIVRVEKTIFNTPNNLYLLRVIDPCFEGCFEHPYIQMLFRIAHLPNVIILTTYGNQETLSLLQQITGPDRFFHLPFPYEKKSGDTPAWQKRKSKLLFSGAMNSSIYPERVHFYRSVRRHWRNRFRTDILPHPGYPDVGHQQYHSIIGQAYHDILKQYKFMFVSGARCQVELLKYTECAEAGCLPVGYAPACLNPEMNTCFFSVSTDRVNASISDLFSLDDAQTEQMARDYQKLMSKLRSAEQLNQQLKSFLASSKYRPTT